ncbi:MAG: metallophosphoesterase, partial [Bacteroidetes bacterium]|nr:metallophosphoesterase [Bacteroidota bacterium]
ALASVPFFAIAYGILIGRFRFHVKEKEIISSHLPDEFDGTRIVHISDLHIGSYWGNTKQLSKVFSMINREKPDLILYTGDMINTFAEEAERFVPQLSSLRARYGKFSVLGNHDYGEYYIWPSENEKINNLERLKAIQAESGFRLLLNESYTIEKGGKKLAILGVENWGLPPFKARGDLQKAIDKTETDSYKILLSHDPSHFPEEVAGRTNIDLTLSGHTHGMQFGFEIAGKKWSPVSLKYKYWDGLYKVGDQFIHVNRGIGFIGFPGRIGMLPEVSVLVLHKR